MAYVSKKVAIIDSGIGGLTVFQHFLLYNKDVSVTYLADNKFFPYGVKKDKDLISLIERIIQYFIHLNYQTIILACNTASYIYNEYLKSKYNDKVYSIIESTINDLGNVQNCKRVGIIATDNTIKSKIYQKEILKQYDVEIFPYEASELVNLCEDYCQKCIVKYIEKNFHYFKIRNIDTLILGCTHFNTILSLLDDFFENKIHLVCSGYSLVEPKKQSIITDENNHLIYLSKYSFKYIEKIVNIFPNLKNIQIKELNI